MITKNFSDFFTKLEKNNSKAWFHAHKMDYELHVKAPFVELVQNIIPIVQEMEPRIGGDAKSALFRINRDIRFSKDKTPYHLLMKAGLSPEGKRSELPGFYLGIGADTIHVGGGLFMVKAPVLKRIRDLIRTETVEFSELVTSTSFVKYFGILQGERSKQLDKSYAEVLDQIPYIANKQFYAMTRLDLLSYLGSDKLEDVIVHHFREIHPLNQFLKRAFV